MLALLPSFRSVRRLQYMNFVPQTKNAMRLLMGVCKTLMPDVVAPEVHRNDRSHVCELSGPTFDSI